MYMNRQKLETAVLCAILAVVAAVGIFFGALFFFHIDLRMCDPGKAGMVFAMLAGSIWAVLLIRNC